MEEMRGNVEFLFETQQADVATSYSLASDSDQGQVPLEDPSPPQRRGKG
jgi:hypothetical protein